jgi:tetratricopeptide (TPR) repeat protein
MPRTVSHDYLLIAAPPLVPLAALAEALAPLRLGVVTIVPPTEDPEQARLAGRARVALGRLAIRETLGRVEVTALAEQHTRAVLHGLAPEALARLVAGLDGPQQQLVRAGTLSLDMHITLVEPDIQWGLLWIGACLEALAARWNAVIFDPAAQRCQTATQVAQVREKSAIAQIALHNEAWGPEARWLHTHGLQKFGQPELEVVAVPQTLLTEGVALLRLVAESLATQPVGEAPALRAGMEVDCGEAGMLLTRNATSDRDHQAPVGRLRLVTAPAPGAEIGQDATRALIAAAQHATLAALAARDTATATRTVERILAAAPDDPDALALQARVALASGQPQAALEIGAFLASRLPTDGRGPYFSGMALLALGRLPEALGALTQATMRDPDNPDPFEARARLNERLGHLHDAASDRARARMLRA